VPTLDRWLIRTFTQDRLPETLAALADAQDDGRDTELAARAAEARRIIAGCDQRLARYRAALEAGTDPKLVARWPRSPPPEPPPKSNSATPPAPNPPA
jgi:site-specific DNA recombinase